MDRRWTQAGGAAGIASLVAVLATLPMQGASPKSSAPAATVAAYVARHHGDYRLVGLLVVVSAAFLAWLVGTFSYLLMVRDRQSPLGAIALLASGGMVVLLAWDGILEVALSFLGAQATATPPPGIAVVYDLEMGIVMPGAYGFLVGAFLLAVAASAFRGVVGGRWIGYLSLVLAALSLAGGCLGLSSIDGGSSSPVSYAPAISTAVVGLVLSTGLLRRPEGERAFLRPFAEAAGG